MTLTEIVLIGLSILVAVLVPLQAGTGPGP